jgi:hypothetical protein
MGFIIWCVVVSSAMGRGDRGGANEVTQPNGDVSCGVHTLTQGRHNL